jgi:2,3-diketo-5-methylthio-1-phosphopentane phosphatase
MERRIDSMEKTVILSDFDGTLTPTQVLNTLYEKFADPSYKKTLRRWNRGEISTMEEVETVLATVTASKADMEEYLRTVELDPGFEALCQYCSRNNTPFAVVSDGFRWYIEYILRQHDLDGIKIFASDIFFEQDGIRFSYPWFDPMTPFRSTSKPKIVRDYQGEDYKVVFIGDGLSDQEVLGVADVVYAKGVLMEFAREKGIAARPFNRLIDVVQDLESG